MKIKNRIIIIIAALIFLILAVFFVINYLIWKNYYQDKIYPGVKIGTLDLGGQSTAQAAELLKAKMENIENSGLKFQYGNQTSVIPTAIVSFDADLSYSLLSFNIKDTLAAAYGPPPARTFLNFLLARFKLLPPREIKALYILDENRLITLLKNNFPALDIEPANAYFSIMGNGAGDFKIQDNPEQIGKEIDYSAALEELNNNLNKLNNYQINIRTRSKYPTVRQADLLNLKPEVQRIIARGNLTLQFSPASTLDESGSSTIKYWEVGPDEIISWIGPQVAGQSSGFSLDQNKITDYLKTYIAPDIDRAAVSPRFEVIAGQVSDWQNGKNGRQLNLTASAAQISQDFLSGQNTSQLVVSEVPDESAAANGNLNIKEIIGTGESNFIGSSLNRIHNIEVGATALQGLLIKPGEEFSLVKALGDISAKTGYLQELVILGDKTTPEYGGGLCQIATTIFRTALASGLPITMRENHSYRVAYYEPAGTDATIYDPLPDLRFINDTGNYILIQARIIKNNLSFDFWGSSDGRIASTTAPVIYNIVKPDPTKIIETSSLKPGEKKCTESAHNGADAYFDYTVTYPANSTTTPIHEHRFSSHYVPWQAVCLVGKSTTSTATSTSEIPLTQKATTAPAASSSKP